MLDKYLVLPVLALILLSGCRSGNDALEKQNAEILAELKRINARLDDVEKQSKQNTEIRPELKKIDTRLDRLEKQIRQRQQIRQVGSPAFFGPTPEIRKELSKIQLPANPSDQQIIDYIRQIREASEGQPGNSSHDPQVALYERIGPGHLHLLFPFLKHDGHHSPLHLMAALPKLVGEADKELVRRSLKQYPILIRCVVSNGWLKEMKKEILALLAQPKEANLPVYELSKYIGDLVQSPDDLKIITDAYIYNRNGFVLLDGLKKLPGMDIRKLVNQAWAEAQKNPVYENAMISRAQNVIRDGGPNIEAVKYLLKLLMISDNPGSQNYRTHVVVPFLSARCDFPIYDPARLREWYEKNADRIVYDPATGKYVVKK